MCFLSLNLMVFEKLIVFQIFSFFFFFVHLLHSLINEYHMFPDGLGIMFFFCLLSDALSTAI